MCSVKYDDRLLNNLQSDLIIDSYLTLSFINYSNVTELQKSIFHNKLKHLLLTTKYFATIMENDDETDAETMFECYTKFKKTINENDICDISETLSFLDKIWEIIIASIVKKNDNKNKCLVATCDSAPAHYLKKVSIIYQLDSLNLLEKLSLFVGEDIKEESKIMYRQCFFL